MTPEVKSEAITPWLISAIAAYLNAKKVKVISIMWLSPRIRIPQKADQLKLHIATR